MESDPPVLPSGTLIAGKLRIVRLLGADGMEAVYEVEHEITKHRRALKLLHPQYAAYPHVIERFLRAKRLEWDDYQLEVTPWEWSKYL